MDITYRKEIVAEPSPELRNKVNTVLDLVNTAVRGRMGEKRSIPPTRVSVFLDNDNRATVHVYVQKELLYSFVLTKHERDTSWACQTDLSAAYALAVTTMERL